MKEINNINLLTNHKSFSPKHHFTMAMSITISAHRQKSMRSRPLPLNHIMHIDENEAFPLFLLRSRLKPIDNTYTGTGTYHRKALLSFHSL